MRRLLIRLIVVSTCMAAPLAASAQERVPHSESTAVGIDVGSFLPLADQFDRSALINVLYEFKSSGQTFGETETKVGLNSGLGIEYFLNQNVALKGEGRYHAIANARGQDPSGLAVTLGLKTYF